MSLYFRKQRYNADNEVSFPIRKVVIFFQMMTNTRFNQQNPSLMKSISDRHTSQNADSSFGDHSVPNLAEISRDAFQR